MDKVEVNVDLERKVLTIDSKSLKLSGQLFKASATSISGSKNISLSFIYRTIHVEDDIALKAKEEINEFIETSFSSETRDNLRTDYLPPNPNKTYQTISLSGYMKINISL